MPASPAAYVTLLGLLLVCQARITWRLLSQALPELGELSLRFHHPGLPLAPLFLPAKQQALASALAQAALGIVLATRRWTASAAFGSLLVLVHTLLLEQSIYQNHYWLLGHVLLCLVVAARRPRVLRTLLRFVHGLPYAFGAIAKLTHDWLVRRQPVAQWCLRLGGIPAPLLDWCPAALSVGGLAIDALMVPLLLLPPRFRPCAHLLAACFHLTNALLFHIGIFPFLMLASHLLWAEQPLGISRLTTQPQPGRPLADGSDRPDTAPSSAVRQHQGLRRRAKGPHASAAASAATDDNGARRAAAPPAERSSWQPPRHWVWDALLAVPCACFVTFHLAWPLRRWLVYDDASLWSQEGYFGAWQMKQTQLDGLAVVVFLLQTGAAAPVEPAAWRDALGPSGAGRLQSGRRAVVLMPQLDEALTPHQRAFVVARPHMLLQYARHRAALLSAGNGVRPAAFAVSCFSLNARPPQPLYRSDVDLLTVGSYEWLGESGMGAWLHPLGALNSTGQPAECEALVLGADAVLRRGLSGFDELQARAGGASAAEPSRADRLRARQTFWHHVGSVAQS